MLRDRFLTPVCLCGSPACPAAGIQVRPRDGVNVKDKTRRALVKVQRAIQLAGGPAPAISLPALPPGSPPAVPPALPPPPPSGPSLDSLVDDPDAFLEALRVRAPQCYERLKPATPASIDTDASARELCGRDPSAYERLRTKKSSQTTRISRHREDMLKRKSRLLAKSHRFKGPCRLAHAVLTPA